MKKAVTEKIDLACICGSSVVCTISKERAREILEIWEKVHGKKGHRRCSKEQSDMKFEDRTHMTKLRFGYQRYLLSRAWKEFREKVVASRGGKCEVCGEEYPLELHHRTYRAVGFERFEDVTVLCLFHHRFVTFYENKKRPMWEQEIVLQRLLRKKL